MPERRRVSPQYIREMAAIHGVTLDPESVERRAKDIELNLARLDSVSLENLQAVPPAYLQPPSYPRRRAK
jgi:hypothetical protein